MKKIVSLFVALVICLSFGSSVWQVIAAKDYDSLTVVDLVRLKKHITSNPASYNETFDYNEDGEVDSDDLIALRHILLDLPYTPVEPDDDKDDPGYDDEGFNNNVAKP